jgi:hypothetical protein
MTEWLQTSDFDQLANSIWDLGKIAMRDLIKMAPAPALVKGNFQHEKLMLEPGFLIRYESQRERLARRPQRIDLQIHEEEPYAADPSFTLYHTQSLSLDAKERTHVFTDSHSIERGAESIVFYTGELAVGQPRRRGPADWRREQPEAQADMERFDVDFFLDTVHQFIDLGLQNKLNQDY